MDADGDGGIGFDEFTLLDEERWRTIDPFTKYQMGLESHNKKIKNQDESARGSQESRSSLMKGSDAQSFKRLEGLSKSYLKIPVRKYESDVGFFNINRSDPSNFMTQSLG